MHDDWGHQPPAYASIAASDGLCMGAGGGGGVESAKLKCKNGFCSWPVQKILSRALVLGWFLP